MLVQIAVAMAVDLDLAKTLSPSGNTPSSWENQRTFVAVYYLSSW